MKIRLRVTTSFVTYCSLWQSPPLGLAKGQSRHLTPPSQSSPLMDDSKRTRDIGGVPYYISDVVETLPLGPPDSHFVGPCTLILGLESMQKTKFEQIINDFKQNDDVWSLSYLRFVIFCGSYSGSTPPTSDSEVLKTVTEGYFIINCLTEDVTIPCGPYWLEHGMLYQVFRLYPDRSNAFVVASVQSYRDSSKHRPLRISVRVDRDRDVLSIAVPSRLGMRTDDRPLAGLRVAIKDNTNLKGITTFSSSRAFRHLYPRHETANETATSVGLLIELGAVVAGKTRTTHFIDPECNSRDFMYFRVPYSPRGDGYQSPSGSSAGSGAAVASYSWLDVATGPDSYGGLRSPAAIEGLFSLRPSHGSTSIGGIGMWCPKFETFGMLTRDAVILKQVDKILHGTYQLHQKSRKIWFSTELRQLQREDQRAIFDKFLDQLESHTGANRQSISLAEVWERENPAGVTKGLAEYFKEALPWTSIPPRYQTTNTSSGHRIKRHSYTPYFIPRDWLRTVEPSALTAKLQQQLHEQGFSEPDTFKQWFETNIIPVSKGGESDALLVLPRTTGIADYRNMTRSGPDWEDHEMISFMIAPFARAPEIIVPIGQTPYKSRITNQEEWLPMSVGIVGARHSDAFLSALVHDVTKNMGYTSTLVGKTAFPPEPSGDPMQVDD